MSVGFFRWAPNMLDPLPGESQPDFAIRFHGELAAMIPNVQVRNDEMLAAWETNGNDGDLLELEARAFPADQYQRLPFEVPAFAEHAIPRQVAGPDGPVTVTDQYNRDALASMVSKNNARIRNGDYCPLADGHTPTAKERAQGAKDPEVLGYVTKYSLGMVGQTSPRWCIFEREVIDKDEYARAKKLTRRSPEVWTNTDPADRIFDPVAMLGATTPQQDKGQARYQRDADGNDERVRYSRMAGFDDDLLVDVDRYFMGAAPSATNAPLRFNAGGPPQQPVGQTPPGAGNHGDETIRQLIDAITEMPVIQWAQQQMEMQAGPSNSLGAPVPPPPPMAPGGPMGGGMGGPPQGAGMPPQAGGAPMGGGPPPQFGGGGVPPQQPPQQPQGAPQMSNPQQQQQDPNAMMQRFMAGGMSAGDMEQYRASYMAAQQQPAQYSRSGEIDPRADEITALREKIAGMEETIQSLSGRNTQSDRYSKVKELRLTREFDLPEFWEAHKGLGDPEWDIAFDAVQKYSKVNTGAVAERVPDLFIGGAQGIDPMAVAGDGGSPLNDEVQYDGRPSDAVADEAMRYARQHHGEVSYDEALRRVQSGAVSGTGPGVTAQQKLDVVQQALAGLDQSAA